MNEKIVINAKNMNIGQGNTNNGTVCIGDNNSNNIVVQSKKKKQDPTKLKFLLFMDMILRQNLRLHDL